MATKFMELFVGSAPDPDDRPRLLLSSDDMRRVDAAKGTADVVTVRCRARQKKVRVRWTECDLNGCRCAIAIVGGGRRR